MDITSKISVFVGTHIIGPKHKPTEKWKGESADGFYLDNKMIERTIESSINSLGLQGCKYRIYTDSRFEDILPDIHYKYVDRLQNLQNKFKEVDLKVIGNSKYPFLRGSWRDFVDNCETDYMLFLEHDWQFNRKVNTTNIIQAFDNNPSMGYLKFSQYDITPKFASQKRSATNWDVLFEPETNLVCDIPLTKISFYSGNPHICRISKCKDLYIPSMLEVSERLYRQGNNGYIKYKGEYSRGSSLFEKEIKQAIFDDHKSIGVHPTHEKWGLYTYGSVGENAIVSHLGDWCRKS